MPNTTCVLLSALVLASFIPGVRAAHASSSPQAASSTAPPDAPPPSAQPPAADSSSTQAQPPAADSSQPSPEKMEKKHTAPSEDDSANDSSGDNNGKKANKNETTSDDVPVNPADLKHPVLWHDPGDIASLDLYYGQGGKQGQPVPPFTFESEDMNGTNPKFDARDANNTKWRVKLGAEARPEVVASRLLWAVGYYVEDDYVLESADIQNLQIKRGKKLSRNGSITDARFARKPDDQKKIGIWEWKNNPFVGTKELNGLRVMMALMNNWDVKDINNSVFKDKDAGVEILLCSDIGATFGKNDLAWPIDASKGNLGAYEHSKFVTRKTDTDVDFGTPQLPTGILIESAGVERKEYNMRKGLQWFGQNIPRQDARWVGSLLGQITHQQLVDAFRAGHFPPSEVDAYVSVVESRIKELQAL